VPADHVLDVRRRAPTARQHRPAVWAAFLPGTGRRLGATPTARAAGDW
jgi:hypothetical protein